MLSEAADQLLQVAVVTAADRCRVLVLVVDDSGAFRFRGNANPTFAISTLTRAAIELHLGLRG